jgi:hypothetical protein
MVSATVAAAGRVRVILQGAGSRNRKPGGLRAEGVGMKNTPSDRWKNAASKPSTPGEWVEARLPDGQLAVAKRTDEGWQPFYPAGSPVAWRPLGTNRFRCFPRPSAA